MGSSETITRLSARYLIELVRGLVLWTLGDVQPFLETSLGCLDNLLDRMIVRIIPLHFTVPSCRLDCNIVLVLLWITCSKSSPYAPSRLVTSRDSYRNSSCERWKGRSGASLADGPACRSLCAFQSRRQNTILKVPPYACPALPLR